MTVINQGRMIEIKYRDVACRVYLADVELARSAFKANTQDWRKQQVAAVVGHLRQNMRRLLNGKMPREDRIYYALGVAAWYANEVYEGRATLPKEN